MDYIGKLLDNRYEIQEVIGSGGMAVVYRALCHRLNRFVAVKILKDEYSQDAEFRRRFYAESQAVAMLSHPNIVSVYDVSHTEGIDYIVMELIDGITLKQYLEQKGKLNWREALHFATQICKALEHAHSRGIIHRDIKPHNIMILKDGSVKVADFGIARVTSAQNTLTREALGSVHYISPEQAKGGRVDCRSDLYSLGVVLYEMLTGRPPYDGDTPVSVAIQHINAQAAMPRELDPSIPEGLEQITMRAMEADLGKRYATAGEMLADLEQFRLNPAIVFEPQTAEETTVNQEPKPVRNGGTKPAPEPTPGKSRLAYWIAAVSIVLVVGGLAALIASLLGDTFRTGEDVTVPDLYLASADTLEETYGDTFQIEIENWVYDDSVAYGLVLSQEPKAERTVKKGSPIAVTVSLGKQEMTMPNLNNYAEADALRALGGLGLDLNVQTTYEDSDLYVADHVIRTAPESGAQLSVGQTVELVVSLGISQETVTMPELIGMDVENALKRLKAEGLTSGSIVYVDSDLPKGTVTFQSIEQGEEVKEKTVVNLQASKGQQETAQIPNITMQPASLTVEKGVTAAISASASVTDGGTLSYEWFTGGLDSRPVGTGAVLTVPTSSPGVSTYYCKITNTLGDSAVSVNTDLARITVEEKAEPVTKVLDLTLPEGEGTATVTVKLDDVDYTAPFTVNRAQGTVQIAVESTGTHVVDIYVDGIPVMSRRITFTS